MEGKTYLTTEELSARIKYDARTIRNRLKDSVLLEGRHYFRPFGGRKILFIWEAIEADMAFPGDCLRDRTRLRQPQEPDQFVDSHQRTSSASAAKALPGRGGGVGGSFARRGGRHRQVSGAGGPYAPLGNGLGAAG